MINKNIIIISSIDWSTHWQMHHQLATSFVASDNRVLFIENTGSRGPRPSDIGRIRERIINWFRSTRGFTEIQPRLTVFSPLFLPFPYSNIAGWINRIILSMAIQKWMSAARFHDPIVLTFLPTPLAQALIHDTDPTLVIYYCANDMAGSSPAMGKLRSWEDLLFRRANLVITISEALRERASVFAKQVHVFPAGVDFAKFAEAREHSPVPADLASLQHPIVGYVGALSSVMDQELMVRMARLMPSVTFALIGPRYADVSRLDACSNIKLLGARPHDEIPTYIKGFDVALIPYVVNQFTDSVYSCKLNEYLAMGVPVVATNMREIRRFNEKHGVVVEIGHNSADFIDKVQDALDGTVGDKQELRITAAKLNGWDQRFGEISKVIEQHLTEKLAKRDDWREKLTVFYKRRPVMRLALLVAAYLLISHTPLVWFAGDQLTVRHTPKVSDAIVVFSGDGESSYINQSYQRRTLDAIHYYKSGYAPLIVLSSGKDQTFSEVEIIKSLLIDRGVPERAIKVLEKYPRSTFENVSLVKETLAEESANSILLITSPYHSRRALWVWRKAMPELVVLAPAVLDTPKASPQWSSSLDQIRVICYEYLAISYYWFKGWL